MRFIRLLFVASLALVLIVVALANRAVVTLHLLPSNFDRYLGGQWSVEMPLFLVILLAVAFGMLAGLVWEWLRKSHLRRESSRRATQIAQLEREVGGLRRRHAAPKDDVLAILDAPKAAPAPAALQPAGAGLPAPR